MNGYDLSRTWFDFCFDNPEKINPNHTAIYFFAIEHCNRLGWKKKFGFPSQMTMDALGIKKHQTYIKYFNDLVDWKFFQLIQKSKNQYSANIISIMSAMPKNGEALDKAIIKHAAKQTESNGQSNSTIVKPVNKETNKPITLPEFIDSKLWDDFILVRKKLKAENTDRAINTLINKLSEMEKKENGCANKSIEESVMNSWKGVFPPKNQWQCDGQRKMSNSPVSDIKAGAKF
jgi:hypothetical protein